MNRWYDGNWGNAARDFSIIIAVCLFALVISNLASQFVVQVFGGVWESADKLRITTFLMQAIGMFAPAMLLDRVLPHDGESHFIGSVNAMPSLRLMPLALSLAMVAVPVMTALSLFNSTLLPHDGWLHDYVAEQDKAVDSYYALMLDGSSPLEWMLNVFLIVVAAAVCEEWLFRGIFIGFLLRCGLSRVVAVVVVAVLFAYVHSQFLDFIPRMAMGIGLGYAYLLSRNIWFAVMLHGAYNAFALCAYVFDLLLWPFAVLGGVLAIVVIWFVAKGKHK